MALSKLKTYDLDEELLKILKKEVEEEQTRLYRMSYSTTLQGDKFTRWRYEMKFHITLWNLYIHMGSLKYGLQQQLAIKDLFKLCMNFKGIK